MNALRHLWALAFLWYAERVGQPIEDAWPDDDEAATR